MSGELDLNQQAFTSYRKLENFSTTSGTALIKRSGTKLLEYSDSLKFKVFSTPTALFVFRSDDTYAVFEVSSGKELKAREKSPINFTELTTMQVEPAAEGLRFYTEDEWYQSDIDYDINSITLHNLPKGTKVNLAITIFGRSVIAYKGKLFFSRYGKLEDFTVGTKPDDGFVYDFVSGIDTEITDIIFFSEIIAFSTKTTIYGLYPPVVNPLISGQTNTNLNNHRLFKLYTAGVTKKTLVPLGNGLVFANTHGVHLLTLKKNGQGYYAEDLTIKSQHIFSEPNQEVVKTGCALNRENIFFVLRNDGVLFKCFYNEVTKEPNWSRQTAGAKRKYRDIDNNVTSFVSEYAGYSYVEFKTDYPYFSDNKLRFSLTYERQNFPYYSFLDAFKSYSNIINGLGNPKSYNEFDSTAVLEVGKFYTVLTADAMIENIEIKTKRDLGGVHRYIHNGNLAETFEILGKFLETVDITEVLKYKGEENLYLTYAELGQGRLVLKTKKIHNNNPIHQIDSFFCVVGFGYEAVAHVYAHPGSVETEFPGDILGVGTYCSQKIKTSTYTDTGIKRSQVIQSKYGSVFYPVNIPGVTWAAFKHIVFTSPEGESCVLLAFGANEQEQENNEG